MTAVGGFMLRYAIPVSMLVLALLWGCGGGEEGRTVSAEGDAAGEDSLMSVVLARVGDMEITYGDVRNHMLDRSGPERVDQLMSQPDVLQVALASLLDQFVWAEMARREGMELTRAEARRVAALESQLLSTRYVGDVVQGKASPSDEDIRAWYKENQQRYLKPVRVGARHILVDTEAEARRLKARAEAGEDFSSLARDHSKDASTRDLGGALGYVSPGKPILGVGRNEQLESRILNMSEGDIIVARTEKGWHVIKAEKKEGGGITPLEEVYDEISSSLVPQKFGKVYQRELSKAREITGAEIDEVAFELVTGTKENTGRLMLMAKQQTDPRSRIEVYRRVAYDFASSKHAAEAQYRLAYDVLVHEGDRERARRELERLKTKYSKSRYVDAGEYLLAHIDEDPELLGSAEDVMRAAAK